ncbi:hypothetical protein GJ25_gp093 [Mycobacterium phage Hawkeye]|uniref:Uncharacterized protein n=1 Tax=Mycobacterium phage Hawkeye TaxID=1458711 RepID=X2KYY9_9CAUD|nr:hypothetical protein GJ25_gp093 [Mycobacterium phage Hawkeye]AHN84104.1 hypothetical protein PBI_HAWKEYE_93 [Mycobacterium phage Hawkeye]
MGTEVSFPGQKGKSLIDKIRDKLDRAYRDWEKNDPKMDDLVGRLKDAGNYGRVEGVAAALGILRGTSTKYEIEEAKERCS